MILRLSVRDLALADAVDLDLGAGLTVLSGETGAGKSVLVEALSLLVGERADAGVIRAGSDVAVVEGAFSPRDPALRHRVGELLGEAGDELTLRREISRDQRNRCFVNGRLAPAALLRELGDRLVELHGQHEHQRLLRPAVQRELLDAFAGADADRRAHEEGLRAWRSGVRRLEELRAADDERASRARRLREEIQELERADLDPQAESVRAEEARRLRELEDRRSLAEGALARLAEDEGCALDLLRGARPDLQALARQEPKLSDVGERFAAVVEELSELTRDIERYRDGLTGDPARLAELDLREAEIVRLKRRYTTDLDGLIARQRQAREELARIEREESEAGRIAAEVAAAAAGVREAGERLSAARSRGARRLASAAADNLRDLGVGAGEFQVRLEPLADPEGAGRERVEFVFAPNAGEQPGPLRALASGGELSRVVLGLKAALARADSVPTLVFDEVDTGIGGRVARRVAEKLVEISRERQVIVVTHLAVIAARADRHLLVEKTFESGRTRIRAAAVTGEERVEELSRMLGGEPGSEVSRRHARELLRADGTAPAGRPRESGARAARRAPRR